MATKNTKRKAATSPSRNNRTTSRPATAAAAVKRSPSVNPTNQTAQTYAFPFSQNDMSEAARQASDTMRSAAENMMKTSNDMMQNMFNQPSGASFPGMDALKQSQKMFSFGANSSEQFQRQAQSVNRGAGESMDVLRQNLSAFMDCCNIAMNVSKQVSAECIAYSNKNFAHNVELSKQVLQCRTLNDMFDLHSRFIKLNLEAFFTESVKLSEMLFQCAGDISEPLNDRFTQTAKGFNRAASF
jgi:hypothetical protein